MRIFGSHGGSRRGVRSSCDFDQNHCTQVLQDHNFHHNDALSHGEYGGLFQMRYNDILDDLCGDKYL